MNKQTKIYLYLKDNQRLGFIQIRNNEPYYGYPINQATLFTTQEALDLCKTFSDKYVCELLIPKKEKIKTTTKIIYKYI